MINITNPKDCCGCTACFSVCPHKAISMKENQQGFLYPKVNSETCVQCGLCNNVCPLVDDGIQKLGVSSVKQGYALRIVDKDILYKSSSGGAFFALVQYVISRSGVVFGAEYDDAMNVIHTYSLTLEGCKRFQGSKYSQSRLDSTFLKVREFLCEGKIVLFTGTPCQNHGLLKFLRKDYKNLITVDIICHSVPSPRVFHDYLKTIEKLFDDKIVNISMRDKTLGWGASESYRYFFQSGREELNPKGIKGWQRFFESGLITRESCFECHYTNLNRVTDFTIGDFWDTQNLRPELKSKEGTSVILVNSDKGLLILDCLKDMVQLWPLAEREYIQPRLQKCTAKPNSYNQFWNLYSKGGFKKIYKRYFSSGTFGTLIKRLVFRILRLLRIK